MNNFTLSACLFVVFMAASLNNRLHAQQRYAEFQVGGAYLDVPEFDFFSRSDISGNVVERFATDDGEDTEVGFGGKLGRIITPVGNADSTRIELRGFYTQIEQNTDRDIDGGFVSLDGNTSVGFLGISNQSTRRRLDFGGYDLLLHQDYTLNRNQMLTFYGGFSGIHLYDDRETGRIGSLQSALKENLNTDYLGGMAGLAFRKALNSFWTLSLDGSLGFYGAHSRYRGSQQVFNSFIEESRSRTDFALGSRADIELKRNLFKNSFIGAFATIRGLSYAPDLNYGTRNSAANPEPLAIDDGELFSAMYGLRLTIFR